MQCLCNHCSAALEFEPDQIGQETACPNCGHPAVLRGSPPTAEPLAPPATPPRLPPAAPPARTSANKRSPFPSQNERIDTQSTWFGAMIFAGVLTAGLAVIVIAPADVAAIIQGIPGLAIVFSVTLFGAVACCHLGKIIHLLEGIRDRLHQ